MNQPWQKCLLSASLFVLFLAITNAKVLLVSMDGSRWDYMNKVAIPNFDMMAQEGMRVPYINYTFIAKTFPCHFTIATGKRAVPADICRQLDVRLTSDSDVIMTLDLG